MKIIDIDDEKKLVQLYDKRMAQEVEGDFLGEDFKGYVFRCVRVLVTGLPPSPPPLCPALTHAPAIRHTPTPIL
jgi:hypothetical protein